MKWCKSLDEDEDEDENENEDEDEDEDECGKSYMKSMTNINDPK